MADKDVIAYLIKLEDRMSGELEKVSVKADKLKRNFNKLEKENKELRTEQRKQEERSKKQKEQLKKLSSSAQAAVAVFAGLGAAMAAVGASVLGTNANLEKFEVQLGTLLGDVDKGKERVAELFKLSSETPFEIEGLVAMDAKLEAFGVNANQVRQGVMDLAATTNMDLVDAADAVGRAMVGGAGAADMLRDKGVKGWVELQAGVKGADMTLDEWRENLVNTLQTNEKIVGGTARLAKTWTGLFSTMSDQWTIFKKEVGDAGVFEVSKTMMADMVELMTANRDMTNEWAEVVSGFLAKGLINALSFMGRIAETSNFLSKAALTWSNGLDHVTIGLNKIARKYLEIVGTVEKFLGTMDQQQAIEFDEAILDTYKQVGAANERIKKNMFEALPALDEQGNKLRNIRRIAEDIENRLDAGEFKITASSGGGGGGDTDGVMRDGGGAAGGSGAAAAAASFQEAIAAAAASAPVIRDGFTQVVNSLGESEIRGIGTVFAEEAFGSEKAQAFGKEMQAVEAELDKLAKQMQKGKLSATQLEDGHKKLAKQYLDAHGKATQLGEGAASHFEAIQSKWEETMTGMKDAIPGADGMSMGQGMAAGADFLATGGMSALSAAGPGGAAAGTLINMGQGAEQEADRQAEEAAREKAKAEQEKMRKEAEQMKQQGFSQDEISAAGLGQSDIREAGVVSEEDIADEREDIDVNEIMAEQVSNMIQGIIEGLPEILSELIPMLLIDLPTAIIESIPELIEQLIPVLIFELPKALMMMVVKLIPLIVKNIFVKIPKAIFKGFKKGFTSIWKTIKRWLGDLFDFGIFQTGGYVPKTGMALLHQGERVIPSSGAGSQTASKGLQAFTGRPGGNLTVNTQVVDPDSIGALGRIIDRELGAFGRSSVPIWGEASPVAEI